MRQGERTPAARTELGVPPPTSEAAAPSRHIGTALSLAPCLPSPACPSSKPRHSNLRTHTALTSPPLRSRPPSGFLFATARAQVLHSALKASCSLSGLHSTSSSLARGSCSPPGRTLHSSHAGSVMSTPYLCLSASPPGNVLSFLPLLGPANSCSAFNMQRCLPLGRLGFQAPLASLTRCQGEERKPGLAGGISYPLGLST